MKDNKDRHAAKIRQAIVTGGWDIDPDIMRCYIKQLNDNDLKALIVELNDKEEWSPAKGMAERLFYRSTKGRQQPVRNPTIGELLRRVETPVRGKVFASRKELRRRFATQSFADQKRIAACLMRHGCAKDVEFLAQYLDDSAFWKQEYLEVFVKRLLSNPEQNSSFMNIFIHRADKATMVRCYRALPMTAQYARERLATALGLDFEINRSDFAPDAFLRICAKTGREEITDSDAIELLKGALAQCFNHLRDTGKGLSYVGGSDEEPLWPVFPDVQNTVWQLAQLGKYQVLLTFNSWIRKVADETERKANGNGLPIALLQNAEALLPELTVNMTSSNGKNT